MKLFDLVLDNEARTTTAWSQSESPVVEKSMDVGPISQRPRADTQLFAIEEGPITVRGESPIQRQRALDGTQHTKNGRTGLQAPEATLYLDGLSKAFPNPDVPEQIDAKEPGVRRTPDQVVKAFLSHEG